jgi:hypothetical protein
MMHTFINLLDTELITEPCKAEKNVLGITHGRKAKSLSGPAGEDDD